MTNNLAIEPIPTRGLQTEARESLDYIGPPARATRQWNACPRPGGTSARDTAMLERAAYSFAGTARYLFNLGIRTTLSLANQH